MRPTHLYGVQPQFNYNTVLRRAQILEVKVDDGLPVCDIQDKNGNIYNDVQIAMYHGNDTVVSNYPIRVDQEVLYIHTGDTMKPVIIGSVMASGNESIVTGDRDAVDGFNDIPDDIHTEDYHVQNGTSYENVSALNGVTLNGNIIRLQIGDKLRISSDGRVIDNVLNGQRFLDILFPYLIELEAKVLANSAAITVIGTDAAAQATARATEAGAGTPQAAIEAATATQITTATTQATTTLLSSTAAGNQIDANAEVNLKVSLPR